MHYRTTACNNSGDPYMPTVLVVPTQKLLWCILDLNLEKETRGSSTTQTVGGVW